MERAKDLIIDSILKQGFSVLLLMLGLYYFYNELNNVRIQLATKETQLMDCIRSHSKTPNPF